jgi:hypothetical protein
MLLGRPHFLLRVASIALGVAAVDGVSAAEWTGSAGVAPAVIYTDNVCLSRDDEKGEWIGTVTPDASISADGNRANFSVNASTEVNSLTDSKLENLGCNPAGFGGDREQFTPRLNGNADAVLIEDWLYIDADANIDQNAASPFVSGGNDSLNRTGNTNTTYRYSVSPYIARRFKDTAVLGLRYTWDEQFNSTDVVGDSTEESAQASLGSVPGVSKFTWALQGDYSKVKYSDTPGRQTEGDSELKSARINLGYQINRAWQLNGSYGDEWNDFVSDNEDIDGDFWDVGLRWTPNVRTTIEVGTGDRFFGNTPRFSISHRHKRSQFSASYLKEITYDRNIRTQGSGDDFAPIGDPTSLSNSPILDERFTMDYSYDGRRTSLRVAASYSDQTREDVGQDIIGGEDQIFRESTYKDISVSLSRSLSRSFSVSGSLRWSEDEPKDERSDFIQQSESWQANLGAQRQLSTNTSVSLDYQYTDRQSDSAFNEYQENRFTLTLRIDL